MQYLSLSSRKQSVRLRLGERNKLDGWNQNLSWKPATALPSSAKPILIPRWCRHQIKREAQLFKHAMIPRLLPVVFFIVVCVRGNIRFLITWLAWCEKSLSAAVLRNKPFSKWLEKPPRSKTVYQKNEMFLETAVFEISNCAVIWSTASQPL